MGYIAHPRPWMVIDILIKIRVAKVSSESWKFKYGIKEDGSGIHLAIPKFGIYGCLSVDIPCQAGINILGFVLINTIVTIEKSIAVPTIAGIEVCSNTQRLGVIQRYIGSACHGISRIIGNAHFNCMTSHIRGFGGGNNDCPC